MSNFTKMAVTAAFLSTLMGSHTVKAEKFLNSNYMAYEVYLECYSPNIQNTGSKNNLKVTFVTRLGALYSGDAIIHQQGTCSDGEKMMYRSPQIPLTEDYKITKNLDLEEVIIEAGGQDALWAKTVYVDQYIKGAPGAGFEQLRPGRWDMGNGVGYCFSMDRGDNREPWTQYTPTSGCTPKMTFAINKGAVAH